MNAKLNLITATAFVLFAGSVAAAESYWVALSSDVSMNRASIANAGPGEKSVTIERNYAQPINFGIDTQSGQAIYPHRSVQVKYVVNCAQQKLNIISMTLFSDTHSQGSVVASEENPGTGYRYTPLGAEEKSVTDNVCGTNIGSK